MGQLKYADEVARIHVPDRVLAHLEIVITSKFRREEAFLFTWRVDLADSGGRVSIWLDSRIPLKFEYLKEGAVTPNRAWLDLLFESANSPGGLLLLEEPDTHPATGQA